LPCALRCPAKSSTRRRNADVLTKLINIFGSKDVFVQEYQTLLADRLVALTDYGTDREVRNVELLKLRFGDAAMVGCEVMLRDVAESRRLDALVHSTHLRTANPVHPHILSRLFWPTFRSEEVVLPDTLQRCVVARRGQLENASRPLTPPRA